MALFVAGVPKYDVPSDVSFFVGSLALENGTPLLLEAQLLLLKSLTARLWSLGTVSVLLLGENGSFYVSGFKFCALKKALNLLSNSCNASVICASRFSDRLWICSKLSFKLMSSNWFAIAA